MPDTNQPQHGRRRRPPEASLSEGDWVAAGTDLLAKENVRGVQIPALCQRLGVTKGSFYWHFGSLADLLRRLLEHWRQRATLEIITRLTDAAPDPAEAIRTLISLPRKGARSRKATALEMNIREWAQRDDDAARAVLEVDRLRLRFFERLFRDRGFEGKELAARAYTAYCMMMGDSILHRTLAEDVPDQHYMDAAERMLGLAPDLEQQERGQAPDAAPDPALAG